MIMCLINITQETVACMKCFFVIWKELIAKLCVWPVEVNDSLILLGWSKQCWHCNKTFYLNICSPTKTFRLIDNRFEKKPWKSWKKNIEIYWNSIISKVLDWWCPPALLIDVWNIVWTIVWMCLSFSCFPFFPFNSLLCTLGDRTGLYYVPTFCQSFE